MINARVIETVSWKAAKWGLYGDDPIGNQVIGERRPGGRVISGFALDPNVVTPIDYSIIVTDVATGDVIAGDGTSGTADSPWSAYSHRYPAYQQFDHGFSGNPPITSERTVRICLRAHNEGAGQTRDVECGIRTLSGDPHGAFQSVEWVGDKLRVRGWALDPDASGPSKYRVRIDGHPSSGYEWLANAHSAHVSFHPKWRNWSDNHGFRTTDVAIPNQVADRSTHRVCVRLINLEGTPGKFVRLGCKTISR